MQQIYQTNSEPMTLFITIQCSGKKRLRVWCEELGKKNSKYSDRVIEVDGKRIIHFNLPVTPKELFIGCVNVADIKDDTFTVTILKLPLRKYNIYMDADTQQFVQFAINFCQMSGFQNPAENGTFYQTKDGMYRIKYFPIIKDYSTGQAINTPARIGHSSGIIEIAKCKFDNYTIPMRMMILLHEFSHKYKNPKIGLKISNEFGADINALYIYLGCGFSKIDAITVFAKVFLKAQTDDNIMRIRKLQDYIQKFEKQEYAQLV
jgi:hypothetical protein